MAQKTALNDWQRVRSLPAQAAITVTMKAGDKFHGQAAEVKSDALVLNTDERGSPGRITRTRNLSQAEILEIRGYRQGASILAGAAIGLAAGAGAGLAAHSNEDGALAAVALGLLGGLLGALIGRHAVIIKGEQVYVAP